MPPDAPPIVVTGGPTSGREAELVELIERAGVCLLSREALEREIPLRRPADDDPTIAYQALISDEPLPPWHVHRPPP